MLKRLRTVFLAACIVPLALGVAAATDAPQTVDLKLEKLGPRSVHTLLRAVVGTRSVEVVDEHTIRVSDTPENVRLCTKVVKMAEHPNEVAKKVPTYQVGDDSVIASVRLRHVPARDVVTALRSQVRIRRIAMIDDDAPTVMVRDTPEQVEAALDLVRTMDRAQP